MMYFAEVALMKSGGKRGSGGRILKSGFRRVFGILFFLFVCLTTVTGRAQSNAAPILNIGWRSNQLQVSILNAATGRVYQIQQRSNLGNSTSWTPQLLSARGQTNFTIGAPSNSPRFFRAWLVPDVPPQILSFAASPATLLSNGNFTLHWNVAGATGLSINNGIGDVTGTTSRVASITGTRTFTLTASNIAGVATGLATVVVGSLPSEHNGRFVSFVSPISGQHFLAPGFVRVFAAAKDPAVDTNFPIDGKGGNAAHTEFLVDNEVVASMDGLDAEYWVFRAVLTNLPPGDHTLRVRAFYVTSPPEILDSALVTITVDPPPLYAQTLSLTQDLVLSGFQSLQMLGSNVPARRVRLNGNGFRIRTSGNWTGHLTLRYADVVGLGRLNDGFLAMDLTTTVPLTVENCNFDGCGKLAFTLNGTATASISSNEFRCNTLVPLSQYPDETYGDLSSYPALQLLGNSTGQKLYRANNMGAGWLRLTGANHWTIGGDADADGNVFIGPRVGIMLESGADHITVRRNYSRHVYFGGWSQGNNFELGASDNNVLVEHNIVRDSSWPVRDVACEFRYNLILGAGHQWMWITGDNANVHHNVFAGGDADVTGIWMIYSPHNVHFYNNTIDGLNETAGPSALIVDEAATADVQSCVFLNMHSPEMVSFPGATNLLNVGHNCFYNPGAVPLQNYSDNSHPATDVGGLNAQVNPNLTNPTNSVGIDDVAVWQRTTNTRQILQMYRTRYAPKPGSPLIDAGHGDAGNDIGAVGAGAVSPDDQFGILTP
jgi:hypothetical protein